MGQAWLVLDDDDPVALASRRSSARCSSWACSAGIVADAVSKRKALYVTQAASGSGRCAGILVATGQVQVGHVYLLARLLGIVTRSTCPSASVVVEMVVARTWRMQSR